MVGMLGMELGTRLRSSSKIGMLGMGLGTLLRDILSQTAQEPSQTKKQPKQTLEINGGKRHDKTKLDEHLSLNWDLSPAVPGGFSGSKQLHLPRRHAAVQGHTN